ncbi:MAG: hypothetical protein Q8L66_08350 [Caulobacter sp.]|nr:hypothetical protein [Caulobacter sp.]
MPVTIKPPPGKDDPRPKLAEGLGWFVGIAVVSAVGVAAVAYALKALLV